MTDQTITWLLAPEVGYRCLGVLATFAEYEEISAQDLAVPMGQGPEQAEHCLGLLRERGLIAEVISSSRSPPLLAITPYGRLVLHQLLESCFSV